MLQYLLQEYFSIQKNRPSVELETPWEVSNNCGAGEIDAICDGDTGTLPPALSANQITWLGRLTAVEVIAFYMKSSNSFDKRIH